MTILAARITVRKLPIEVCELFIDNSAFNTSSIIIVAENEHYSTVSGLIRLVISLECFIEITPDFLCPFMND